MPAYNLYQIDQVWRNTIKPEQWFIVIDTNAELVKIREPDKQTRWLHYSLLGDCYEMVKSAN